MDELWNISCAVVIACTLLSTIRISVVGLGHLPVGRAIRAVSRDGWNATLFILMPMLVGSFARGEVSALPWLAYSAATARHGIGDGIGECAVVVVIDLWLLWIPAHSYAVNHPEVDKRILVMARLLNLAVGLLLVTPDNPIYKLIGLIPPADPDDPGY